jgi:hypothetical protein
MARKLKHYFINWIDGMKISKDHFISTENAVIYQNHLVGRFLVNPYNFGLLPGTDGESPLDVSFEIESGNQISVTINRCRAITSGGIIIDLDADALSSGSEISIKDFDFKNTESASGAFYIIIKVNPYNRVPAGDADPAENPPRHPFVTSGFLVSIVPVEQMGKAGFGDFFLVVGKIAVKDNRAEADKDYIPPCSRVRSDSRLLAAESKLTGFFTKLEADIMVIIRKIHTKQQKSPLAGSIQTVVENIASWQAMHITQQRLYLKDQPPVFLIEAIAQFARLLRNTLNIQPPERKEEMINYFSDWCNLKQGELEKIMLDAVNFEYNHYEINSLLTRLMTFTDTMAVLFDTLSQLEYIGKRRDTQIYIKEEEKPRKSFLADD